MATQYRLIDTTDLTFDEVILEEGDIPSQIPENLRPTASMQDKFMKNCAKYGILEVI